MNVHRYKDWITEEGLLQLEAWARAGFTKTQIAKNCGVDKRTLNRWENKFEEVRLALKRGLEVADIVVENALYKKATGYYYTDETVFKLRKVKYDGSTGKKHDEVERIEKVELKKYLPPDTQAQIFWLKNRKPNEWRDRKDICGEGNIILCFDGCELTQAEMDEISG